MDQGKDSYVVAMAISPDYANDGILIVSVKGRGLFKTDNSGKTFTEIGPSIVDTGQSIEFITFSASYATDGTIYAASEEELLLSTDKGATWTVIDRPVRYENRREVVRQVMTLVRAACPIQTVLTARPPSPLWEQVSLG